VHIFQNKSHSSSLCRYTTIAFFNFALRIAIFCTIMHLQPAGLELSGEPPTSCLQTLILGVKIGFKFQSLGKISNISTADPLPVLLGQFQHCYAQTRKWPLIHDLYFCRPSLNTVFYNELTTHKCHNLSPAKNDVKW